MASGIYTCFITDLGDASVNWETDTIKVCLLRANHTFSASHTTYTDIFANELAGTGNYTVGGAELGAKDMYSGSTKLDAADASWASATFTAYHAVLYDVTNSNSLICSIDFGQAQPVTSTTFTIRWDTAQNAIITYDSLDIAGTITILQPLILPRMYYKTLTIDSTKTDASVVTLDKESSITVSMNEVGGKDPRLHNENTALKRPINFYSRFTRR